MLQQEEISISDTIRFRMIIVYVDVLNSSFTSNLTPFASFNYEINREMPVSVDKVQIQKLKQYGCS